MSLFKRILYFLKDNKKDIIYYTIIGIIFLLLSTHLSFANNATTPTTPTVPQSSPGTISTAVIDMVNGLAKMAAALLGALTFLVGLFLYPGWTSGSVIGLTEPLKTMWIMISNVVYFIFAFIFIWIAFMNILGKEDGYQLKKAIPRFIVGVLIVPFSWFFVQFVISLSNVLTVGVLSLPYDTFKNSEFFSDKSLEEVKLCEEYRIITTTGSGAVECIGRDKITLKQIIDPENSESLYGLAAFYTYGVMKVDSNGFLYQGDVIGGNVRNIFDLSLKLILDIIFVIIYALLMIALVLALFVRGVMLWVYAMFSPLFGLLFFFNKSGGEGGGIEKKFNIKEFVSLAMVPVYVAGALAFGLVFLFVAGTGFSKYKTNELQNSEIIKDNGNKIQFGPISYSWSGSFSDSQRGSIDKAMGFEGSFGTLLLQLFGLGILWMALMSALKTSTITESAVEPIRGFGNSIGELIKKAPGYMPIIPAPGGPISGEGLRSAGSTFTGAFSTLHSNAGAEVGKKAAKFMGIELDRHAEAISQVGRDFTDAMLSNDAKKTEFIDKLAKATGGLDELAKSTAARSRYSEQLSRVVTHEEGKKIVEKIKNESNPTKLAEYMIELQKGNAPDFVKRAFGGQGSTIESIDDIKKFFGGTGDGQGQQNANTRTPIVEVANNRAAEVRVDGHKVENNLYVSKNNSEVILSNQDGKAFKLNLNNALLSDIINNQADIDAIKKLFSDTSITRESDKRKVLKKMLGDSITDEQIRKFL